MSGAEQWWRASCGSGLAMAVLLSAPRAGAAPTARLVYSRAADATSCPDEVALCTSDSQCDTGQRCGSGVCVLQ